MIRKAFFLCLLLVSTLLVIGCEKGDSSSLAGKETQQQEAEQSISMNDIKEHLPIVIKEGKFDKIIGWLDGETFVYTTKNINGSNIYAYHLKTGTSTLLLNVEAIIDSIHISHSGNYLLIRSSSEEVQSKITIITDKGKLVFSGALEDAFDAAIEWNPYDENKVLISSFTEDWQDRTFILSIKKQRLTEIDVANPFSYWAAKNKLIYLNWNQNDSSKLTDVVIKDLSDGKDTMLLSNVYQLDSFQDVFLTITPDTDQLNNMIYSFYYNEDKKAGSITMPGLTSFSDWLIPYYDYNVENEMFLSFQPVQSGDADSYTDGFQLFQYKLGKGKNTVILDGLNNEPISCNKEGTLCLYGYYLEKLIDIKNKTIMKIVHNIE